MTNGSNSTLYVLYGSATGNAEGISKDLTDELNENQDRLPAPFTKAVCQELDQFKKCLKEWTVEPSNAGHKYGALIVCSTTGNGDPPENAGRFNRYVKKQSKDKTEPKPFKHLAYAVLALGDTNYDQFCATGKLIDQKMKVLGGTRASKLVCVDEGTGLLEETVEPWMATVAQDVAKACLACSSANEEKDDACVNGKVPSSTTTATTTATKTASETKPASTPVNSTTETKPATSVSTTGVKTAVPEKSPSPLYILYGSATGNAEQIAKDLAATYQTILDNPDSLTYFQEVVCAELNQFKKMKLMETLSKAPAPGNDSVKHGILVVASTTGNGEAPENSDRFLRYIKKTAKTGERPLENVAFSVLALGDTNYDQYCQHGEMLNKFMLQLGGSMIRPLACADEGTGQLEEVVEGWTENIIMDVTVACRGECAKEKATTTTTTTTTTTKMAIVKEKKEVHEEEKKMEMFDDVCQPSSTSPGVCMVRSVLSLTNQNDEVTCVEASTLPRSSLKGHVTSVEFVSDNDEKNTANDGGAIINDDDDDDQSEDGVRYTCAQPFESSIVGARYLTATSSDAANEICEVQAHCETSPVQEILDRRFPLQVENDVASADRNGKRVIELTLAIPDDQSWVYEPGDSIGMIVTNTPDAVSFVLNMLQGHHGISPSQKVSIDCGVPLTVEEIVSEKIDLCTVMKSRKVLYALSQISNDPQEKAYLELLSSKTDRGDMLLETYVNAQRRSIVDLLREFPSCQTITLQNLVSFLPPIPPRYYSVSSSPLDTGRPSKSLTVTFSVVDYLTPSILCANDGKELGLRRIHGVATRHLEALSAQFLSSSSSSLATDSVSCLKIFPKPTEEFHLPTDLSTPLVLIGPGTGIAPFMGFLAHRKALIASSASADVDSNEKSSVGSVEIFFGCRHAKHDYLYQKELQIFQNDDVIDHLHTAFSRDDPTGKKVYVQNLMTDDSERLVDTIIHGNGIVYVCGDGNHMGRDVQATISKLISPHLQTATSITTTNETDIGKSYLEEMKSEGRFLMDIWS
jgi:sulfite reductase alpha subunit-like flavoprotein